LIPERHEQAEALASGFGPAPTGTAIPPEQKAMESGERPWMFRAGAVVSAGAIPITSMDLRTLPID